MTDKKIQNLERNHRWQLFALDLLAEMSAIHGASAACGDRSGILGGLESCLSKMFDLEWGALLLVDDDSGFKLRRGWPSEASGKIAPHIDALIAAGHFAWALNRNHPELSPAADGQLVMLNVIATSNEVHGMFVGRPAAGVRFSDSMKKMLAVVLHNAAYALENAALYGLVKRQRDDLEIAVELRNRELEYYSRHDVLTGQANRDTFLTRIESDIDNSRYAQVLVIYVDVDAFNRVNGSYGYQVGDRMLVELAGRLRQSVMSAEICGHFGVTEKDVLVARLGGDEFAVLLPDPDARWQAGEESVPVASILSALSQPYCVEGETLHVSCSIGVSCFPAHGSDARTLLDCADIAMHHVKQEGSDRFASYLPGMEDCRGPQSLLIESALHRALEERQFYLCYQPKVDLISERITSAEALLRWRHPERGEVGPTEFIELAESSGLIVPIGEWVLADVCRQLRCWREAGLPDLRICVNMSAVQMRDPELPARFAAILEREQADATRIELELTETAIARDVEAAVRTLSSLHELGFSVAIDDFGTGYSSLQLLRQFPLDTLKIDRSFVRDLNIDPGDAAIVAAVVQMGHSLHLQVIAEGVETREQLSFLRSMGCHEVQGYYVSKPLPTAGFEGLLRDWRGIP